MGFNFPWTILCTFCFPLLSGAQDGSLRLVGGGTYAGRVEIYFDGIWGTICDDNWNIDAARVVCRQVGLGEPISAPQGAIFGEGLGPTLLDDVICDGNENLLLNCSHKEWYHHDCGKFEDASVICTRPLRENNATSNRIGIRLAGGSSPFSGRVEINYKGEWGTICDDFWDIKDAHVVCRQLGMGEALGAHMGGDFPPGPDSSGILLESVQCHGFESSIDMCVHSQWRTHDCEHLEDAGVSCQDTGPPIEGAVRLVDGLTPNEGRVEVYHNHQWKTLCDDHWDINNAHVVCRHLGYESAVIARYVSWDINNAHVVCRHLGYESAVIARLKGFFGQGPEEQGIWLDNIQCNGTESSLLTCVHGSFGSHGCTHAEDAGVVCRMTTPAANHTDPFPIRLVDGKRPEEGRVEVYRNGQWGTVCDSGWDIDNAHVVCRQLGYSGAMAAKGNAYFGEGIGYIMLDKVECIGSELVLAECTTSEWYDHRCQHTQDVGVVCATEPGELAPIRLAGSSGPSEGRLEIFHEGVWSTVCDDEFGYPEANVVCAQLGYKSGIAMIDGRFGEGKGRIALDEVKCRGDETSLAACIHDTWYKNDCTHSEDVGVICDTGDISTTYTPVRLRGGTGPVEGRVEVYHDGAWGSICDDQWDINDALVVCHQLGFVSAIEATIGSSRFGGGFGHIFLDEVECSGTEASLGACSSDGWYNHNCDHTEDAGVICDVGYVPGTSQAPWTYLAPVRLVGGTTRNEGRVEVNYHGKWGSICDDSWDINEAHVVCRQLGYREATQVKVAGFYGESSGPVLMDNVNCNGWEASISLCAFNGWYDNDCLHKEDAGVVCSNGDPGYSPVRLVGGAHSYEGRVEMYHDGQWGKVCDNNWDIGDATVVCNQLGYISAVKATRGTQFGVGVGKIMLDSVGCFGWETSLLSCAHSGLYNHNCKDGHEAGVICWHYTVGPTHMPKHIIQGSKKPSMPARLRGGRVPSEGRVEVLYNGVWGTVCDDGWDLADAEVLCHHLGYPGAKEPKLDAFYGRGTGPILVSQMGCMGYEEDLGQCQHSEWYYQHCTHFEDAGVVCQTSSETDPLTAVRLVGGSGSHEGRVEVFDERTNRWGTLCDDSWGQDEAEVTCRQLGFNSAVEATSNAFFGEGAGPILYSNFDCWGYEPTLADCDHSGWQEQIGCQHEEDAGVICSYEYGEYNGRIRLVNGGTPYEGRIEIYYNQQWGTLCDDSWDINAANVVCRQLGYGVALEAKGGAYYGQGSGPILLDDFFCYGDEFELASCNHPEWGTNDCSHSEDIGVVCSLARENVIQKNGVSDGTLAGISIAAIFGIVAIVAIISYFKHRRKTLSTSESLQKMLPIPTESLHDRMQEQCDNHVTIYTVVPPGQGPPYPLQSGARYIVHQRPPPPYAFTRKNNNGDCNEQKHLCQTNLDDSATTHGECFVPSELPSYTPANTDVSNDSTLDLLSASGEEKRLLTENLNC